MHFLIYFRKQGDLMNIYQKYTINSTKIPKRQVMDYRYEKDKLLKQEIM